MRFPPNTAAFDDRYGVGKVSSRIGLNAEAQLFNSGSNLFDEIQSHQSQTKIDCIFIDEAQFLTKQQVRELVDVVDDLRTFCYTSS